MPKPLQELHAQYLDTVDRADRLREVVVTQLNDLVTNHSLTLGVPIESRVKTWQSIEHKIERKSLAPKNITDLNDLIGVRLILLFHSDLLRARQLIADTFVVLSEEDTSSRLGASEFGYQSQHFLIKLPSSWLGIPSHKRLGELALELQVRTVAQHIWAVASHKLQYKNEASVPPPLRRAINRVSALLEIVDLEFDRVLTERDTYVERATNSPDKNELLNVDNLKVLLREIFPPENLGADEDYADLLANVYDLGVRTISSLKAILEKHYDAQMVSDKAMAIEFSKNATAEVTPALAKFRGGHFYTYVGLARGALRREFGELFDSMWNARIKKQQAFASGLAEVK